jgi:hypothetical protein
METLTLEVEAREGTGKGFDLARVPRESVESYHLQIDVRPEREPRRENHRQGPRGDKPRGDRPHRDRPRGERIST